MKTSGNELTVLLRKISWIAVGVCGFGVVVGAVLLAVEAPPGAPPAAVASKGRSSMRPHRASRYRTPMRSRYNLPAVPKTKIDRPPTVVDRRVEKGVARPDLARPKLGGLNRAMRPALAGQARPGRLSKEELEKRRDERRKRQVERLRKRIQTLEERISSYKQDGTRTEAQVSRMERSLDRMRKRLKRMEEKQAP
jgi:hypothetical protein